MDKIVEMAIKKYPRFAERRVGFIDGYRQAEKDLAMSYPLPEDTVLFQKGVEEGRRLEKDDLALSIDDIEKIHVFLYAIKNNKQGVFTFTRLSDEQYKEVLQRFINIKDKRRIEKALDEYNTLHQATEE